MDVIFYQHVVVLYLTGGDDQSCHKIGEYCKLKHKNDSKDWWYNCNFVKKKHIENITIYSQKGVSENVILEYKDGRSPGRNEKFDFIQKGTTLTLARFNATLLYTMPTRIDQVPPITSFRDDVF